MVSKQQALAVFFTAALPLACSNPAQSDKGDTTPAPSAEASTPTPFAFTDYPTEARIDNGRLGAAQTESLIAASTDSSVDLSSTWQNGPSVVVFYRGHW